MADSTLESDLIKALSEVNDPAQRMVLGLLLRTQKEISNKLDTVLADESKIRQIVLNGHTEDHHDHHVWLEGHLRNDVVIKAVNTVHDETGLCYFARAELERQKENKSSTRKIRDALIQNLIWGALVFVGGALSSYAFLALKG